MKKGVRLVEINKLRAHEEVSPQRLVEVMGLIRKQGMIVNPIVIDKENKIILDGHHRVESLKRLGYRLVPVMEVDYFSTQVRVIARRKELEGKKIKEEVVKMGLNGRLMLKKSTKHIISERILGVKFKINRLK